MASDSQVWVVTRGEDAAVAVTGADNTNPAGWTLQARVLDYPGQSPPGLTVTPTVSGAGPYTITAGLTSAQTAALAGPSYTLEFWRTDPGSTVLLASGLLVLGPLVLTPAEWQSRTGISVTGADAKALANICVGVSDALGRMLAPYLPVPRTLTLIVDAPPTSVLVLPVRPVRSVTAVYLHPGAGGDDSQFAAADLLAPGTDYYSPVGADGTNGAGILHRRAGGGGAPAWGSEYRYPVGALAPQLDPDRGAVKVVLDAGEPAVPEFVKAAATAAATLLFQRRKTGAPLQSEAFGGYTYSAAGPFTADAAVRSPDVLGLLHTVLTPKFG